jgi:hypothetical protein
VKKVKLKTVEIDVAVNIKDTKTTMNRQASPAADQGRTIGTSGNYHPTGGYSPI